MKILSDEQLKKIASILEDHIGLILYITNGQHKPNKIILKKLGLPENITDIIKNSFVLGKLIQMMKSKEIRKMTYEELKEKAKEIELTKVEENSLNFARQNAGRYVTALGRRIADNIDLSISQASHDANLEVAQRQAINQSVQEAIIKQETRSKLTSELGHNTGDWTRDWRRVAHTEIWNAKLQGEVLSIVQGNSIYSNTKGGDTLVFRRPSPDACNHCKRLYLERDEKTPKIFKLSELINNGTNVGKKVGDWAPITGTTHPNCSCPIAVLPDGFGFDENGELQFVK